MILLKNVIHYTDTNTIEATWVNEQTEEYDEVLTAGDGTQTVEKKTRTIASVVRCHSYADVQMQMFKDDIAIYGGDVTQYAELIATVEANIVPYVPPALTESDFTLAVQNFLDATAQATKWDSMQSARAAAGIPLDGTESEVEVAMHADAVKLARWYLKIWAYCYEQLDAIKAGSREAPTSTEAFIEELPKLGA